MKKLMVIIVIVAAVLSLAACTDEVKVEETNDDIYKTYSEELFLEAQLEKKYYIENKEIIKEEVKEVELEIVKVFGENRPFAIMIDNYYMARPQSSISQGKIIYEVLAEARITRYLIVMDYDSDVLIGPIRSARPYFLSLAMEYDGLFVHVGGSTEALRLIKEYSIDDLDGMRAGYNIFWREKHKSSPNNMYSDNDSLRKEVERLRYDIKTNNGSDMEQYNKTVDVENGIINSEFKIVYKKPTSSDVDGYIVKYIFNEDLKVYERYINGKIQKDETTNEIIDAGNIIIQIAKHRVIDSEGRREIDIVGNGEGYYFSNGLYIPIKWEKNLFEGQTKYYNNDGKEIIFNPGRIFIQIIETDSRLEIKEKI